MPRVPNDLLAEVIEAVSPTLVKAARVLTPDCSEDSMGEARLEMVQAAQQYQTYNPTQGALSAYLFQVGRTALLRVAERKTGRQRERKYKWGVPMAECPDGPEAAMATVRVEDDLTGPEAEAILGAVKEKNRPLVLLAAMGYTRREIGQVMGLHESTVKTRFREVRQAVAPLVAPG